MGKFEFYSIYKSDNPEGSKDLTADDFKRLEFPKEMPAEVDHKKKPANSGNKKKLSCDKEKGSKGSKTYSRFLLLWKKLFYEKSLSALKLTSRPNQKAIDKIKKDVEKIFRIKESQDDRYNEVIKTFFSFDHNNSILLSGTQEKKSSINKESTDYNFDA